MDQADLLKGIKEKRREKGKYEPYPKMLNVTRKILDDFYRPYNQDLADLLQDSRFLYLDP